MHLNMPATGTRFGDVCETHAKTFDPPNTVSFCADPQQLCKYCVFMEIFRIILSHQSEHICAAGHREMRRSTNKKYDEG